MNSNSVFILTHGEYSDTVIDSIWTSKGDVGNRLVEIKSLALAGKFDAFEAVDHLEVEEWPLNRVGVPLSRSRCKLGLLLRQIPQDPFNVLEDIGPIEVIHHA